MVPIKSDSHPLVPFHPSSVAVTSSLGSSVSLDSCYFLHSSSRDSASYVADSSTGYSSNDSTTVAATFAGNSFEDADDSSAVATSAVAGAANS